MIQGSEEWKKARLGKVTASRLIDVVKKKASGAHTAARESYMTDLICEKLSGRPREVFVTAPMRRGVELEPEARNAYSFIKNENVIETGFVLHSSIDDFGASPDGLVGDDGLLEIKCPNTSTHIEFLKTGKPKEEYIYQMHGQMICTGRKWCDFVSYDDRLEGLPFKCKRIYLDEDFAQTILTEVNRFLVEMKKEIETLNKMKVA